MLKHSTNFESAKNVRSSNVVEFEFELRHIPNADVMWLSKGRVLARLCDLIEEIKQFLHHKRKQDLLVSLEDPVSIAFELTSVNI